MTDIPNTLLHSWLQRQLPEAVMSWFKNQLAQNQESPSEKNFYITLGMIPRRLGKDDLQLDSVDLAAADALRPGWDPRGWSVDTAARVLVLAEFGGEGEAFTKRFTDLCRSADLAEAIAFYKGLPLYPAPELLEAQAAEGVRTHILPQFEAIAHQNPYPREQFNEQRWNNMVVKALFIDSSLSPIQGLDERANPDLAKILCDLAHERWAAGRKVSPELWRCVGPFAKDDVVNDLQRVLTEGSEPERMGAALALAASPDPRAEKVLNMAQDLQVAIVEGKLTWKSLEQEI